ncbi:MAG TPA: glycosyltransferase [Patescibacteria group bacterium]|nr:glycosyltransferase [Patescibacteria group bacterium]
MNGRKSSLKIAQIANISERVPPKKYGGIERVISALTEELVERGHRVTLFATNDSQTSAKLISVYPRSLREAKIKDPYGLNEPRLLHIATAYRMYDQFDIIHDHNSLLSLPTAQFIKKPVIITLHTPVTPSNKRLLETVIAPYYVAISQAQTAHAPNIQISDVIYNGLPMEHTIPLVATMIATCYM